MSLFNCPMRRVPVAKPGRRFTNTEKLSLFSSNNSNSKPIIALPERKKQQRCCMPDCKVENNMVNLPRGKKSFVYATVLADLLNWAPDPLPVICKDCWLEKTPGMANVIEKK